MASNLKIFGTAFGSFLLIDYLWLNFVAKNFYLQKMQEVGNIQDGKMEINLGAGLMVYVFLALGIVRFVLPLLKPEQNTFSVFLSGAFLGLIVYGVYDMTNLATLKSWPLSLAVVDTVWGALVTGLVVVITVFVQGLMSK